MKKQTECNTGKEYGCPYRGKCDGNYPDISIEDFSCLNIPEHLWYFTKTNLTKTSKIWFNLDKQSIYICQPNTANQITFYESERKKLEAKINKTYLNSINKLRTKLENKIRNLDADLK